MIASTLNFLNFCGLSNIIFIHLSREKLQFNPQLSQLFQPLYSVSKINQQNQLEKVEKVEG
jgi:hypothetical protein